MCTKIFYNSLVCTAFENVEDHCSRLLYSLEIIINFNAVNFIHYTTLIKVLVYQSCHKKVN